MAGAELKETYGSMAVARGVAELRAVVGGWKRAGERVGVVPTMGALHAGHMALVEAARQDCDRVIATIFVNPKQFNRPDDLSSYPRDEASDAAKLNAAGVDLLFTPPVEEVYPEGFQTKVSVPVLSDCLCGLTRPGHMDGVATVVAKLFLMTAAERAYFGEKDYQQLLVVRRMARDLDIPVQVVPVPTVRDTDGLALSSRNALLSAEQRAQAPVIHRTLAAMARRLAAGETVAEILAWGHTELTAGGIENLDYLQLRADNSLEELVKLDRPARLFVAGWMGKVRLIDNVAVPVGA
ncbi:pantoate--beta-alanine ligase [Pelagibius marinus]|uniref:pantoate--beta-alanine ligase n=1 Tax=Pelagibius marinus TaxID=2762760 RepID=UPI0029CAA92F|nr:pantoate--beta-alanine ligase [Pelagibius marinus]